MNEQILLNENRGVFLNNVENHIDIEFSTKFHTLPSGDIAKTFSLLEQYNTERDECNKFRIILSINPVCSNVLFNKKTEILINEGSVDCTNILDTKIAIDKETITPNALNGNDITYSQAIRDTEYSHENVGGFTYHCGIDIFNNHLLRKKGFVRVNKYNSKTSTKSKEVFNTISDYCRDGHGNIIKDCLSVVKSDNMVDTHLYQYDTIMSMPVAFLENCFEKDGWWGFTNPSTMELNDEETTNGVGRLLLYKKPCEFVDLYPDRSLFSFIPKYNKYRKRIESNWDYCLTYPFAKDSEKINEVCGGKEQAIRAIPKKTFNSSSLEVLQCASYFKHNLKAGDYVTFFYYDLVDGNFLELLSTSKVIADGDVFNFYNIVDFEEDGTLKPFVEPFKRVLKDDMRFYRYEKRIQVLSVGDANGQNIDRIFNVRYSDVRYIAEKMNVFGCFYKKNSGSAECSYYFRKFKKLKTIDGLNIKSEINKIGFGQNIYGDEMAQIIFTDDIDLTDLIDHNGRGLSEIFLTVIKRNKGYKKWYSPTPDITSDEIEYSHCFGEVTSGVDFSGIEDEPFDYNVRYLHNIKSPAVSSTTIDNTIKAWGKTIMRGCPEVLENNITIDTDVFYGDIIEFDINNFKETVIGQVYHRFNTAQREYFGSAYKNITHDEIVSDDYDKDGAGKFEINTYYLNNAKSSISTTDDSNDMFYGNISPEGYFYQPHSRIKLREEDVDVQTSPAKYINYANISLEKISTYLLIKANGEIKFFDNELEPMLAKEEGDEVVTQNSFYEITLTSPINYGFFKGDYICFFDRKDKKTLWGEIIRTNNNIVTVRYDASTFDYMGGVTLDNFYPTNGKRNFYAFWTPNNVPLYAQLSEAGQKFTWRNIVAPSNYTRDNDLYDIPFANGSLYIEQNINIFLKRQDPTGKYGLSNPITDKDTLPNPMIRFNIIGHEPIDLEPTIQVANNVLNNCY